MPGKPHRQQILQRLVNEYPAPQPLSAKELEALDWAVFRGLWARLGRVAPKDAEAVGKSMQFWVKSFGGFVEKVGLENTKDIVTNWIAKVSLEDMKKVERTTNPIPLQLFFESVEIMAGMPGRKDLRKREDWLKNQGIETRLIEEVAKFADADLAEAILSDRHGMSLSSVHKSLAKASTMITSTLKPQKK